MSRRDARSAMVDRAWRLASIGALFVIGASVTSCDEAVAQTRHDAGRRRGSVTRAEAAVLAQAFAIQDAGPPDANAPAADWNGTLCAARGASGALGITIDYATCTSGMACTADLRGHDVFIHAFWWGQISSGCFSAMIGHAQCATTAVVPTATLSRLRIDGAPQAIDVGSVTAGTTRCWQWPEGMPIAPSRDRISRRPRASPRSCCSNSPRAPSHSDTSPARRQPS